MMALGGETTEIGEFFVIKDGVYTQDKLAATFKAPVEKFAKLNLPQKFNYVYLDQFKLNPAYRGKGYGAAVLAAFFGSFKAPTLVCLDPGELSSNVKFESIVKFYKRAKMIFIRFAKDEDPSAFMLCGVDK